MPYKKHPLEVKESGWEDLDEGETLRIHCNHPLCMEKNDALTVTRILGGCIYNCYRCGSSGAIFRGSNPKEAIGRIKNLRNIRHTNISDSYRVVLPRDFLCLKYWDKDLPPHALAWLFKYELDIDDAENYNIGYSKRLERVIIPVYHHETSQLIAWTGRDIYYNRNKALFEKGILKEKPLKYYTEYNKGTNNNEKLFFRILNPKSNKLVLTEDMLSAIKVATASQYNVIALLNATLYNALIESLNLHSYSEVLIWLDPDKKIESLQGALRWNRLGINTKYITSPKDPKEIPYTKIGGYLGLRRTSNP